MSILVTGGAGFIGSNFVLDWLAQSDEPLINLDKLTYAGNIENLQSLNGDRRHVFVQGDIGDSALVTSLLAKHQPRAIINFAAESHVDRSIHGPEDFIQTNIVATFHLLEAVRAYWHKLQGDARQNFRLLHVSTDEVYGSLAKDEAKGLRQPIHAEDVAGACSAALQGSDVANRAYNISGGETLTYREMVARIFTALGRRPRVLTVPLWAFRLAVTMLRRLPRYRQWSSAMAERMNRDLVFDHAEAARDLGFKPRAFELTAEDLPT